MFVRRFLGLCVALSLAAPGYARAGEGYGPGGGHSRPRVSGGGAHRSGGTYRSGQSEGGRDTKADGTVVAVARGAIQMTSSNSQSMVVGIGPMTNVRMSGRGSAELLRAGMCVEFVADVAKNGVAKDKVGQLTIFTPTAMRPLGLYPESAAFKRPAFSQEGEKPAGAGPPPRAIGRDPGIGGAAAEGGGKGGRRGRGGGGDTEIGGADSPGGGRAGPSNVQLPAVCTVRGQIKTCHNGSLAVSAGRSATVKVDLADNAQVDLDVADYTLASPGDRIQVTGKTTGRQGMVLGENVQIDAIQPLGTTAKKSSVKGKGERMTSKQGRRGKEGEKEAPSLNDLPEPDNKEGAAQKQ